MNYFFKSANKKNVKALAEIILAFGEVEGKSPFNNDMNKVYDFIDDYKKDNEKSYEDIYMEFSEVINNEGFFLKEDDKGGIKSRNGKSNVINQYGRNNEKQ